MGATTSDDGRVREGSPPLVDESKPLAPGWVYALNLKFKYQFSAPSDIDVVTQAQVPGRGFGGSQAPEETEVPPPQEM